MFNFPVQKYSYLKKKFESTVLWKQWYIAIYSITVCRKIRITTCSLKDNVNLMKPTRLSWLRFSCFTTFLQNKTTVALCGKQRIVVFVESVVSAVLKVTLIRPRISTSELHCALTLRPPEVDQTGITAAPPQEVRRVQSSERRGITEDQCFAWWGKAKLHHRKLYSLSM